MIVGESITERHVQAAWYDRQIRPEDIRTSSGEHVSVIHPGSWNLGAGPDFKNAVIVVGGRRMSGDIEVHLRPNDWCSHSHGGNPAYRNVIAHITWCGGPVPKTLPKNAVSICLGRYLTSDMGFAPEQIDVSAYPFSRIPAVCRPCFRMFGNDVNLASKVLCSAGHSRIMAKARRLERLINAPVGHRCSREQLFYAETMNALGYGSNPSGFREIASIVPLASVMAEPENAESAFLVAAQFVNWRRGVFRPNNSPEVRLKSAARLFATGEVLALLEERDFSAKRCREVVSSLVGGGFMGRGRAGALFANVFVPFAIAEGRIAEPPAWIPPEDVSEPVRLTAFRIFGCDHNPSVTYASNGLKIQGLIHIHRTFCLSTHPECENCKLARFVPVRESIPNMI
jgi:hypothetical protein